MIMRKISCLFLALATSAFLFGCGGSGGSSSTGTASVGITDAKPLLADRTIQQVVITFDEISVHAAGVGWASLPLAQDPPMAIDLLQFSNGHTTELVPPVKLATAHYTKVRIGVTEAYLMIEGEPLPIPVEIPSEDLKTDKQFDFQVVGGGAVDLIVDFDLSGSIVETGDGTYKLKPVIHLNHRREAATVQGQIGDDSFGASEEATVIVTWDTNGNTELDSEDEVYTRLLVEMGASDPTAFEIFWLVPNQGYFFHVDLDGEVESTVDESAFELPEFVPPSDLYPGAVVELNAGEVI